MLVNKAWEAFMAIEKVATVACRLTEDKKELFYSKCTEIRKLPTNVLESLIDMFLEADQ
jgi:hypothetical protein